MLRDELPKIKTAQLPGPKAAEIIERRKNIVPNAIRCVYPCVMAKAEGAIIEDVDGNYFLDWIGGVGVLNVGYSPQQTYQADKQGTLKLECCNSRRLH